MFMHYSINFCISVFLAQVFLVYIFLIDFTDMPNCFLANVTNVYLSFPGYVWCKGYDWRERCTWYCWTSCKYLDHPVIKITLCYIKIIPSQEIRPQIHLEYVFWPTFYRIVLVIINQHCVNDVDICLFIVLG